MMFWELNLNKHRSKQFIYFFVFVAFNDQFQKQRVYACLFFKSTSRCLEILTKQSFSC